MSAGPGNLSKRAIDEQEIEQLLDQRELLDATELIAKIGHCQWGYRNNRLLSCSQGYARIDNMSVDEIIALQNSWEQSLALVKRIVEVHGGRAWIESEGSGAGTSVFFTLPKS